MSRICQHSSPRLLNFTPMAVVFCDVIEEGMFFWQVALFAKFYNRNNVELEAVVMVYGDHYHNNLIIAN